MRKNIHYHPRRVATSAVVVMLIVRCALGEQGGTGPSAAIAAKAPTHLNGTIVWEWRFDQLSLPQSVGPDDLQHPLGSAH